MKAKIILLASVVAMVLASCNGQQTQTENKTTDSVIVEARTLTFNSVEFTHAVGEQVEVVNEKLCMHAGAYTDFFIDPMGTTFLKMPMLLKEIDNTKPFTLVAKVTPQFTEEGLYNAGGLIVYSKADLWQKLCFEQDERGNHRIVTVKTNGTSDDNNHEPITLESVYMKISSNGTLIGCYFLTSSLRHPKRPNTPEVALWHGAQG